MNDIERATKALEQSIKYCVELGLTHFKTATRGFPKSISVEPYAVDKKFVHEAGLFCVHSGVTNGPAADRKRSGCSDSQHLSLLPSPQLLGRAPQHFRHPLELFC
jgi:hypothetical protein